MFFCLKSNLNANFNDERKKNGKKINKCITHSIVTTRWKIKFYRIKIHSTRIFYLKKKLLFLVFPLIDAVCRLGRFKMYFVVEILVDSDSAFFLLFDHQKTININSMSVSSVHLLEQTNFYKLQLVKRLCVRKRLFALRDGVYFSCRSIDRF